MVVGAWGRWGRFDQQLQRGFVRDHAHRNFGFKRHYRGEQLDGLIELYSFDRGYLGVSGVEGGITNICGLVHETRLAGHKGRWESFIDEIRREEPRLERMYSRYEPAQEAFLSSEPVIFRARSRWARHLHDQRRLGIVDPLARRHSDSDSVPRSSPPFILGGKTGGTPATSRIFARAFAGAVRRISSSRGRVSLTPRCASALGGYLLRRTRADRDDVARLAGINSRDDCWWSMTAFTSAVWSGSSSRRRIRGDRAASGEEGLEMRSEPSTSSSSTWSCRITAASVSPRN
jgi:hypothetical protein